MEPVTLPLTRKQIKASAPLVELAKLAAIEYAMIEEMNRRWFQLGALPEFICKTSPNTATKPAPRYARYRQVQFSRPHFGGFLIPGHFGRMDDEIYNDPLKSIYGVGRS